MNKEIAEKILSIKENLSIYKKNTLGIDKNGMWKGSEYSHILPFDNRYENIINKGFREDLKKLISQDALHFGFPHLNSSQALALNLFGPLVLEGKLSMINNVLEENLFMKNNNLISNESEGKFEFIEQANEGTNFDFYIQDKSNKYYFEVKYTENDFGKAKDDLNHQQKYSEFYKGRLNDVVEIDRETFFKEYQLWRNIIYARNGYVFFVLPNFRTDLIDKVNEAIKITNDEIKKRVNVLIIDRLVDTCKGENIFKKHYEEFEKKYLLFDN